MRIKNQFPLDKILTYCVLRNMSSLLSKELLPDYSHDVYRLLDEKWELIELVSSLKVGEIFSMNYPIIVV